MDYHSFKELTDWSGIFTDAMKGELSVLHHQLENAEDGPDFPYARYEELIFRKITAGPWPDDYRDISRDRKLRILDAAKKWQAAVQREMIIPISEKNADRRIAVANHLDRQYAMIENLLLMDETLTKQEVELFGQSDLSETPNSVQPTSNNKLGLPYEVTVNQRRVALFYAYTKKAIIKQNDIAPALGWKSEPLYNQFNKVEKAVDRLNVSNKQRMLDDILAVLPHLSAEHRYSADKDVAILQARIATGSDL